MAPAGSRMFVPFLFVVLGSPLAAQATRRVSVSSGGAQADNYSFRPAISADGRRVVFDSRATNLVPGDANDNEDVFVHDRVDGTTIAASVDSNGVIGDGESLAPSISADGRYVVFVSSSTDLVPGGLAGSHIFLRDLQGGTTERVSVNSSLDPANQASFDPVVSGDGRYVAFASMATNLALGDTNLDVDIFVRDRQLGTTERASVGPAGVQANLGSYRPSITPDGRYVLFESYASNLVAGDTNGSLDTFLRDRLLGTTERVNLDSSGNQITGNSSIFASASISADGRFVAFSSDATNVVPGDTNARADVFLRDRTAGTTERVSVNSGEAETNGQSFDCSISADGRFVAFQSFGSTLVLGDTNGKFDVFVRDRQLGTTERVSLTSGGVQGHVGSSEAPVISGDGRWVAFESFAADLVPGDTNTAVDIFLRDRETAFSSLCHPGAAGITACPCSNPSSGPGHGCENSSGTGGAVLTASGAARLSADSLVFSTSGEKPTALSILLQGTQYASGGLVYGQGVRCVGGSLKRLYSKSAVGGSITVPDFGGSDLPVSQVSAAKGDPIQPGQPRWYLVYYRDNTVLGGCASTSNFNATQTGQVNWTP